MKLFEFVKRVMCPPLCICCKKIFYITDNALFCPKCEAEVRSRIVDEPGGRISNENITKIYRCMNYGSWYSRKIITHAKYVSSEQFQDFIGKLGKEFLEKHNLINQLDYITFAPRRRSQITLYGFDQSEEIGKAFSRESGIPCEKLLKRKPFTLEQKKLKGKKRAENVKGKFICDIPLTGKRILLIDDVITSGSTICECAKMLKNQGAAEIYVWTLAQ